MEEEGGGISCNEENGTKHTNDFFFYHGAFSLMTAKETLDWMREKEMLKHWILPEQNLNKGT
eukprot:14617104-Ditylum_brightwellii.AAC.1